MPLLFLGYTMKKCVILSENTVSEKNFNNTYRNIGAMEVAQLFRNYNIDTTIIEWILMWEDEQLEEAIDLWFADSSEQLIGISVPFSLGIVYDIIPLLSKLKEKYPKLQIIIGGNRTHDPGLDGVADLVFMGRSIETLHAWLQDQDMMPYSTSHPQVILNDDIKFNVDVPVLPPVVDHDLLTKHDVLGFEIGIGCKFNCSFCSYDLRNVKNPLFVDSESLRKFLQDNYDNYGVTSYYIADDTLNESDEKLEILAEAVEALTFEVNLVSFLRIDLLERRKQQYALLERIKLKGVTMGIETLTPAASKIIRKSPDTESTVRALQKMAEITPMTFKSSGMIIGLTGDSHEEFWNNMDRLTGETLVHGIYPSPLRIRSPETAIFNEGYLSDFAKNPEKFGYTITGTYVEDYTSTEQEGSRLLQWENDWTHSDETNEMCEVIVNDFQDRQLPLISAFEWITLLVFGIVNDPSDYKIAGSQSMYGVTATKVDKHKKKYINRKLEYLRNM